MMRVHLQDENEPISEPQPGRPRLLYIAASAYSGTTLLSFLLNSHPAMFTVGHTMGWPFGEDEAFYCSCGARLDQCPFFATMADAFAEAGLPFDIRNFGTLYRLVENERVNRYLTAGLPLLESTRLERLRDTLVQSLPSCRRALARQDLANRVFIETALRYSGAEVYVDNSQIPHRMRHLQRIGAFDIRAVHLVRDLRGVTLSNKRKRGWSAALGARIWCRQQAEIVRLLGEFPRSKVVFYEDLCDRADAELAAIHSLAGVPPVPFDGDFKQGEHHILGNAMRLQGGDIRKDESWRDELSAQERTDVENAAWQACRDYPSPALERILRYYFDAPYGPDAKAE